MVKLPLKKTQLATRVTWISETFRRVRWMNNICIFWHNYKSLEIGACWFQTLPSRNVVVFCTRWRLSAVTPVAQWLLSEQKWSGKCSCEDWWKVWSVLMWGTGLEPVLSSLIICLCDHVCEELAGLWLPLQLCASERMRTRTATNAKRSGIPKQSKTRRQHRKHTVSHILLQLSARRRLICGRRFLHKTKNVSKKLK